LRLREVLDGKLLAFVGHACGVNIRSTAIHLAQEAHEHERARGLLTTFLGARLLLLHVDRRVIWGLAAQRVENASLKCVPSEAMPPPAAPTRQRRRTPVDQVRFFGRSVVNVGSGVVYLSSNTHR
jgi:hypothetical protein